MRNMLVVVLALLLVGLVLLFTWGDRTGPSGIAPSEDPVDPDGMPRETALADVPAAPNAVSQGARRDVVEVVPQESQPTADEPVVVEKDSASVDVRVVYRTKGKATEPAPRVPVYVESLAELSRSGTWRTRRSRRTDETGVARFERLQAGFVRVTTALGGEQSSTLELGVENTITLVLPPGFALRGSVADPSGAPVQHAAVWVSDAWQERRGETLATTDVHGEFSVREVRGHRYVSVSAEGFIPSNLRPITAEAGDDVALRFVLQRGTTGFVRGRVVDLDGGPVADARVLIGEDVRTRKRVRTADGSWAPGPPPQTARTAEDGTFLIRGVPPDAGVRVQARGDGFGTAEVSVDVLAGTKTVAPDLVLGPPAALFGTVENADGTPAPNVMITLDEASFAGGRVNSDQEGNYRFDGLAPGGEVELRAVTRSARAYAKVLLADAVLYRVDLELVAAGNSTTKSNTLRVRIVGSAGEPQSSWRVVITPSGAVSGQREHGLTDKDGRVELPSAYAEVALQANAPGGWAGLPPLFVPSLSADGIEHELRVPDPLTETGEIRGRILDSFGQPHEASIEVWHEERRLYAKTRSSAATGEFRFENVWPGPYRIDVHSAELPWLNLGTREIGRGEVVDLGNLSLEAGGSITGTLRIRGGGAPPAGGLDLALIRDARQVGVVEYAEGTFRSNKVVPAEDYMLIVRAPRVAQRTISGIQVRQGDATRLDVELEPAAERVLRFELPPARERPSPFSVLIRSVDPPRLVWNGAPMPDAPLEVRAAVPPGTYRVEVFTTGNHKLGDWPLRVDDLSDADAIVYVLD